MFFAIVFQRFFCETFSALVLTQDNNVILVCIQLSMHGVQFPTVLLHSCPALTPSERIFLG